MIRIRCMNVYGLGQDLMMCKCTCDTSYGSPTLRMHSRGQHDISDDLFQCVECVSFR